MEEMLSQKDNEMKAMEERYKRYLEKAKSVRSTLLLFAYSYFTYSQVFVSNLSWTSNDGDTGVVA